MIRYQVARFMASVALLLVVSGCGGGGSQAPTGSVSGTVTFQGTPVTEGDVNLISRETGQVYAAPLGDGGSFKIADPVQTGSYIVSIAPPLGAPPTVENPTPVIPNPANIPQKYRSDQTSDLKADVKAGENTFTFDMKP